MSNQLLSEAIILDAIERANIAVSPERGVHFNVQDGTYRIIPTWVGNVRVFQAERIIETEGYEIAYGPVMEEEFWYPVHETRFGIWTDPDTGIVYLDQTIHVRGNFLRALEIGSLYSQIAIWDWAESRATKVDANDRALMLARLKNGENN